MNLEKYQIVKLKEVARFERAQPDKTYPEGTSTIQISATRGQVGYLWEPGQIETKEAAILPDKWINPVYFNLVLQRNMERFTSVYQTGLNIKIDEIGEFQMQLHDRDTQDQIVLMMTWMDDEIAIVEKEIGREQEQKKTLLDKMFVNN